VVSSIQLRRNGKKYHSRGVCAISFAEWNLYARARGMHAVEEKDEKLCPPPPGACTTATVPGEEKKNDGANFPGSQGEKNLPKK